MSKTGAAELVAAFYERLWNAWDDTGVEEVLAEDFTFRGSLGTATVGRDGWRGYRDGIRRAAPDFHNEVFDLVVDGERAAARLRYTGTHTGRLLGYPPTGRAFTYDGAAFFTVHAGRLTTAWVLGDLNALAAQLGTAMPATRTGSDHPAVGDSALHGEPAALRSTHRGVAPHYEWGTGCDGWRLVDREDLSVIEERMPPGAAEEPHVHDHARQFFYVLSGHAELRTARARIDLDAGTGVEVPPGHPHQFVNVGLGDVTFLVTSAPSTRGDRHPYDGPLRELATPEGRPR